MVTHDIPPAAEGGWSGFIKDFGIGFLRGVAGGAMRSPGHRFRTRRGHGRTAEPAVHAVRFCLFYSALLSVRYIGRGDSVGLQRTELVVSTVCTMTSSGQAAHSISQTLTNTLAFNSSLFSFRRPQCLSFAQRVEKRVRRDGSMSSRHRCVRTLLVRPTSAGDETIMWG